MKKQFPSEKRRVRTIRTSPSGQLVRGYVDVPRERERDETHPDDAKTMRRIATILRRVRASLSGYPSNIERMGMYWYAITAPAMHGRLTRVSIERSDEARYQESIRPALDCAAEMAALGNALRVAGFDVNISRESVVVKLM